MEELVSPTPILDPVESRRFDSHSAVSKVMLTCALVLRGRNQLILIIDAAKRILAWGYLPRPLAPKTNDRMTSLTTKIAIRLTGPQSGNPGRQSTMSRHAAARIGPRRGAQTPKQVSFEAQRVSSGRAGLTYVSSISYTDP